MKTSPRAGFTIMETTLFLAVTGLLILMILTGTGVAIGTQRYQDAVETLKSDLQGQYAELASVQNNRNVQYACGTTVRPAVSTTPENVGQSNCLIAGRYVRIANDQMTVYNVLARQTSTTVPNGAQDITIMRSNYVYNVDAAPVLNKKLEWGTHISWPRVKGPELLTNATADRTLGMVFMRSPYSGQVYTFSAPNGGTISDGHIKGMMHLTETLPNGQIGAQGARIVCVASGGLVATGDRAIYIGTGATTASSIETATNDLLETKVPADREKPEC